MKYSLMYIILMCSLMFSSGICSAAWDTVIFREDFNAGSGPDNRPDPEDWVINHPESWWWVQGRSLFPNPESDNPLPRVEDGKCIIEHHLYNQHDSSLFIGGEIHTVMAFEPTTACRFEARVRCNSYPNGLVSSFFTYGHDGVNSDEIDFEFVSNKTNDQVNYPDGDPVLTNTYNESFPKDQYIAPPGLNLNEWNTFRIYWYPGQRVEWTWLDPVNGEILLRSETDTFFIPDQAMNLYFNFWASDDGWLDAYDSLLLPVDEEGQNVIYTYEIDYAEVCIPEPATCLLLGLGWVLLRKKQ